MISSAFVEAATYMYAPGLSEFVCVPFFFFLPLPGPPRPHLLLAQGCFVSYFVSLGTAVAGYFVSFQVSFRLGARDVTKRKESFGWLLKRNPNPGSPIQK